MILRIGQSALRRRLRHHPSQSTLSTCWRPCLQPSHNLSHDAMLRQRYSFVKTSCFSFSSDSFHGISLDHKINEKTLHRSQIKEAEVVQSAEDVILTRGLIKEVTRAKLTAHYSDVDGLNEKSCDTSDGDAVVADIVKLDPYERRLKQLDEAQRLHRDIDPTQTMKYMHSCIIIGELQYEIGHLDDAQETYMTALKYMMSINGRGSGIDCGDEYPEESGKEHLMIAQCMHSLGAIYARCGEYDEALRWYNESLKRKQQILLDVSEKCKDVELDRSLRLHFELGKTYNGLATLEAMMGGEVHWEKAESLFREAEATYLHGYEYDVHTVDEPDNHAVTDRKLMDTNMLTKAAIQRMTSRHVMDLINVRSNMGELLRQRGQYENAVATLRSALEVAQILLECEEEAVIDGLYPDEQRNVVVDLLLQIADVLMSANSFDEAATNYEQALSAHILFRNQENDNYLRSDQKSFLPSPPTTPKLDNGNLSTATRIEATIRTNLAHALAQMGKENLSAEQYKAALSIKRRIGGDFHMDVAHTLMDFGSLLGGPLNDFTKALICFKEALYIYRTNLEDINRASELDSQSKLRSEKTSMQPFYDDDDTKEMERHIENALKNISLIEAALLKDRDGKSIRRRK